MTNKELYDQAVANGLQFTYFHGENIVPDDFEDTVKESFWEMEIDCAERNVGNEPTALEFYQQDLESDKTGTNENQKRIPPFISESTASDAAKAVAYDCYSTLRYNSNGYGAIVDPSSDPSDGAEETDDANKPFNWNRGFDNYFTA